jgi:hypothetical protein
MPVLHGVDHDDLDLSGLDSALSNGKVKDWFAKIFTAETGIEAPFESSEGSEPSGETSSARLVARVDPDAELVYSSVISGYKLGKKDKLRL